MYDLQPAGIRDYSREKKNKNAITTLRNKMNVFFDMRCWKRNVSLNIHGKVRVELFWSEMSITYEW